MDFVGAALWKYALYRPKHACLTPANGDAGCAPTTHWKTDHAAIAALLMLFAMTESAQLRHSRSNGARPRGPGSEFAGGQPAFGSRLFRRRCDAARECDKFILVRRRRSPPPCPTERVTPRLHSLGVFASGNYTVEVSICADAPPFRHARFGPRCSFRCSVGAASAPRSCALHSTAIDGRSHLLIGWGWRNRGPVGREP